MLEIIKIEKDSIAEELGFEVGDKIVAFNGREVFDFIDFTYMDNESELTLTIMDKSGKRFELEIEKDSFEPLGVEICDNSKIHTCKNKCAFCFVDQLPKGMRESLYVKDDDWRYSLICGNYVTLTNLTEYDLERICDYHISPLYVSVHATDDDVRLKLVKNPNTLKLIDYMKKMGDVGIKMHTQIVMCKGINDGEVLRESIDTLTKLKGVESIAVVPVGLTAHREGLYALEAVDKESAQNAIEIAEKANKDGFDVWCSDEMYLRAQRDIPSADYYKDYSQIENGVGIIAKFRSDFQMAISSIELNSGSYGVVTGTSAKNEIENACKTLMQKNPKLSITVYPIPNKFFGESVTVTGLVTGQDIVKELKGKNLPETILVPSVMLKEFEDVFLDGMSIQNLEKELGRKIVITQNDGESFARAFEK